MLLKKLLHAELGVRSAGRRKPTRSKAGKTYTEAVEADLSSLEINSPHEAQLLRLRKRMLPLQRAVIPKTRHRLLRHNPR